MMEDLLKTRFAEAEDVLRQTLLLSTDSIAHAAKLLEDACRKRRGIFLFGNGGSAADAQHVAGELNGRFLRERQPLKAQALVGDAATMTCIANDYGYDQVFSRQLQANAESGDVAFGFTTSGNSKNVIEAFKTAKSIGMKTIALTGKGGGAVADLVDVLVEIQSGFTPHIQEVGMVVYHCLCEQIDTAFYEQA
jgi:D-sedoheptulose 7-phosphate isomerase